MEETWELNEDFPVNPNRRETWGLAMQILIQLSRQARTAADWAQVSESSAAIREVWSTGRGEMSAVLRQLFPVEEPVGSYAADELTQDQLLSAIRHAS